jgi:UDP:flavonoid glycosyltransferase YjiC (YdhE family)
MGKVFVRNKLDDGKPVLLVFPYNVMAHYLRCLKLAKYFQPYYNVKFLHSSRYHSFILKAGFETFECAALDADKVQKGIAAFDFSWLNESDLFYIYNEQVKAINKLKPIAVLGDMSPTLKMAAEKTGVVYLSLINGYMSRYYAYVRRMPRSYALYNFFHLLPANLFNFFANVGEHLYFHDLHRPFSKIRKSSVLSPKHSYMQELEGDINLLCDLPELFPQRDLPSHYYFIPPLYHQLSDDTTKIESIDTNKKTIYVTMGSTGNWKDVAFLNGPGYDMFNIITAGDRDKVIHGSNVFSYDFVDSCSLFSIVDVVICHGGNGSVYQALSFGIPVLCNTSHLEQEYNVDGLERQRLGKRINDVKGSNAVLHLIKEWMQKKNEPQFSSTRNNITEAESKFEQTINAIVKEIDGIKITG